MPSYVKAELSGSTDGRPIAVAATSSPGTTLHTARAVTGDDNYDEIHLEASNIDTEEHVLTLEVGGTSTSDRVVHKIPPQSTVVVLDGAILQNSVVLKAYADEASQINAFGYANEVTA